MKEELKNFHNFKSQLCPIGDLIVKCREIISEIQKVQLLEKSLIDKIKELEQHKQQLSSLLSLMENI